MAYANGKSAVLMPSESSTSAKAIAIVNRVSKRIIDAAGLQGKLNWQVVVVKSNNRNAFVMPNGKIVVFTGVSSVAKNEAGLAAIIGHEVAHVIAHHQAERMSQVLLAQLSLTIADIVLAASDSKYQPAISAGLGLGAQYGVLLPFSREHESEADHIGLFIMAKAGYDPSEAIGVWERMEAAGGSGPWELLSTHPSDSTRRANIRKWLPEANLYYADRTRSLPASLSEVKLALSEQVSRTALAPTALSPWIEPGYWYQYRNSGRSGQTTYRVARKEKCPVGECLVFSADDGTSRIYTTEGGLVELGTKEGARTRFFPPLRLIKFPLKVGDSWTETVSREDPSGRRQAFRFKTDVLNYESVNVSGKAFMAFKIITSLGGIRYREDWYAPEARTYVRIIIYNEQGHQSAVGELVGYQLSADPAGPMNTD